MARPALRRRRMRAVPAGSPCHRSRAAGVSFRKSARPSSRRSTSSSEVAGDTDAQAAGVAEAQVAGGLQGVEVAGGGMDVPSGEEAVGVLGAAAVEGDQQGRGAAGRPGVDGRPVEGREPLLEAGPQPRLVLPDRLVRRAEPGAAVAVGTAAEPGEDVDGRAGAGQQLVGQGAQLEPLGHRVRGGQQLVRAQGLQQFRGGGQRAVVRAEELVRRADEEVRAERPHVHRRVRRVVHTVDVQQGARLVDQPRDLRDRGHGADEVGGGGHRDQAGARGELRGDVVGGQLPGGRVEIRAADGDAYPLGRLRPGADVGVVVELGDDHLVALRPAGRRGCGRRRR